MNGSPIITTPGFEGNEAAGTLVSTFGSALLKGSSGQGGIAVNGVSWGDLRLQSG